jgi:hypothetical protein
VRSVAYSQFFELEGREYLDQHNSHRQRCAWGLALASRTELVALWRQGITTSVKQQTSEQKPTRLPAFGTNIQPVFFARCPTPRVHKLSQKSENHLRIIGRQRGDVKRVPYRGGSIYTGDHHTKTPSLQRSEVWCLCTPAKMPSLCLCPHVRMTAFNFIKYNFK